jgi:hypothetical protein
MSLPKMQISNKVHYEIEPKDPGHPKASLDLNMSTNAAFFPEKLQKQREELS